MVNKQSIKKIIAIGLGVTVLGGLAVGCTTQKQTTIEQQAAQLAELSAKLNESQKQLEGSAQSVSTLEQQNAEAVAQLEGLKLTLDAKDKALLEWETSVAVQQDLEEAELVDNLALGEVVADLSANHYDVDFLQKSTVYHDGEDYDVEETVSLSSLKVATSLSDDEELADQPYLYFTEEGSVEYQVTFKDDFEYEGLSEDEPMVLNFAGKSLTVVGADEGELQYKDATSFFLKENESLAEQGLNIQVKAVAEKKVMLDVNGQSVTLSEGQTKSFGTVEVRVRDTFYKGYAGADNFVELDVGANVLRTVQDGDEFVEDDDTYVWSIETNDGKLESVGVRYDVKADDQDEAVLKAGESLKFLDYFSLKFDLEEQYDYQDADFSLSTVTEDDVPAVRIDAWEDGLKVGSKRLDKAYLSATNTTYWKQDGDWMSSNETLSLVNDDVSLSVSYQDGQVVVGDGLKFATDFDKMGATKKEAESTDVTAEGTEVGEREESVLLSSGVVVKTPEANADKDKVSVSVPNKEVKGALYLLKQ